jgi:hypothetical protein
MLVMSCMSAPIPLPIAGRPRVTVTFEPRYWNSAEWLISASTVLKYVGAVIALCYITAEARRRTVEAYQRSRVVPADSRRESMRVLLASCPGAVKVDCVHEDDIEFWNDLRSLFAEGGWQAPGGSGGSGRGRMGPKGMRVYYRSNYRKQGETVEQLLAKLGYGFDSICDPPNDDVLRSYGAEHVFLVIDRPKVF